MRPIEQRGAHHRAHKALDWLCLNVPPDALPDTFKAKRGVEKVTRTAPTEWQPLLEVGYTMSEVEEALLSSKSMDHAHLALMLRLCGLEEGMAGKSVRGLAME